jgi:hypothetical protein
MAMTEKEIVLRLPSPGYRRLQEWAGRVGKSPESLTREIVEQAVQQHALPTAPPPRTARQILQAAGRVRSLSPALQQRIIPGVTLEEVRASLARAGGQPLSEIVLQQRESRS